MGESASCLQREADPFACDIHGDSTLWCVIRHDNACILAMIGSRGAFLMKVRNIHGFTPLQEACLYESYNAIRMLMQNGTDINSPSPLEFKSMNLRNVAMNPDGCGAWSQVRSRSWQSSVDML